MIKDLRNGVLCDSALQTKSQYLTGLSRNSLPWRVEMALIMLYSLAPKIICTVKENLQADL